MRNLIITGFMGTGKTAIGREVARRLGCPFVDMDSEIEARAGKSIPRIFAEDGEPAFRRLEAELCQELCTRPLGVFETLEVSRDSPLVIATGGGALVDPANRARMMESGTVVCLTCSVGEILRRVSSEDDRPLLDVADPRAEVERLLEARREAYAAIPWQIDTTGLSVEEAAERVMALADVITLPVRYPGGTYDIHVGEGLLAHVGGALRAAAVPVETRIALVSNDVVAPLYGDQVRNALREIGFRPFACVIPDGEQHKTLATVNSLYEEFLAGGLDRSGTVLSLGGGVTGDIAGFAAATFMRGVRFAQLPTTLLSMVDASVGGKTGVDLPQGKNLVGAFKQPSVVVIDPAALETLEEAEFRSGMAEVIKHGVIGEPSLFAELEANAARNTQHATRNTQYTMRSAQIARALQVKIHVVEEDPFEQGRRAVLNLGHTVGHALEKRSGFALRHGEAVSIGMVAAARIAAELGRAEPAIADRIEAVLSTWGLPVRCPSFETKAIWQAMTHDKKRRRDVLRWVLPRAIGEVEIAEDVPQETVISVLRDLGAS